MRICHTQQLLLWPLVRGRFAALFAVVALLVVLSFSLFAVAKEGVEAVDEPAVVLALPDRARQSELVYLVRQDCGSCHGMTLKGGLGTPLLPENVKDTPVEALVSIILDGIPDTPMPPWRGLLSEPDAEWIARQLKKGLSE